MPVKNETKKLNFLFTEKGFLLDEKDETYPHEIQKWKEKFGKSFIQALYNLGFEEKPAWLDAAGSYLYMVADQFLQQLTRLPDIELLREKVVIPVDEDIAEKLLNAVPFTLGSEHVTLKWIQGIFTQLQNVFADEIKKYDGTVSLYLADKSQHLRVPERIFFHLVECKDKDYPFAFLATYATKDSKGKVKHMPLRYALTEYNAKRDKLLELLACLNKASEASGLIGEFVTKGEMFHPLRLTAEEAWHLLKDIPAIEQAGIVCRIPNWWKKKAYNISMSVNLGEEKPSLLGMGTILQMVPQLTVDGITLTQDEIRSLQAQTEGLAYLKGKWIEVNHSHLEKLLQEMENYKGDLTLLQALRMGIESEQGKAGADVGPIVTNGTWLSELLKNLRTPRNIRSAVVPKSFHAVLRPYQKSGYTWLNYMDKLGFGACLADDMGLGKTVQVLAYLEKLRKTKKNARVLLVVPASLIGNWQKESEKFAPEMSVVILHGGGAKKLGEFVKVDDSFLTITTYGMVTRIVELEQITWDCLILDEAQAIKNPTTKQTRQVKKLKGSMRIAMSVTPIENDLTNLWSLVDFLNKGLLGGSQEFHEYCKHLEEYPEGYA